MLPLSRRALLLATPALLLPGHAFAAFALTPRATAGPFYPSEMPADDDSDLVRVEGAVREAGGDVLHLAGKVLDGAGRPFDGVRVEIWQCDAAGVYLHPNDRRAARRDVAFQGFGHAETDTGGVFAFRTIVPEPYPGRTPHIHLRVATGSRALLTTQFYRAGFPQNASDGVFSRLSPAEQERVSMRIAPVAGAARPTFASAIEVVLTS